MPLNSQPKKNSNGVIITNSEGIIIDSNAHSNYLLDVNHLVGRPIKFFMDQILSMKCTIDYLSSDIVYSFGDTLINTHLEKIFNQLDIGIFIAHYDGLQVYHNTALDVLLRGCSKNILEDLQTYTSSILSFNLIKKTQKKVQYDFLIHQQSYTLKLVPSSSIQENVDLLYGFLSPSNQIKSLETKVLQLERTIKNEVHSAVQTTIEKKPHLQLHSKPMKELYDILSNISNKGITILFLGQSGTGKSSLAKAVHNESRRQSKPFVTINCSALSDTLIESELFGYEKGAFTGAVQTGKKGLIEIAEGGTLFIDEIGEIPFHLQGKLLELVQEKTYRPVGGVSIKSADVRLIVATNKDLYNLVLQKKFREDLYYRIAVAVITIPPLSEHPEDIRLLIDTYLLFFNKKYDTNVQLSYEAKQILLNYNWPGNIRELEHIVEFLLVRSSKKIIEATDLPFDIINHYQASTLTCTSLTEITNNPPSNGTLKEQLAYYEKNIIKSHYQNYPNSYKLAEHLGISQSKAYKLIQKHCI